jgi:SDR family mycofactocin-dependent oxidoreductase
VTGARVALITGGARGIGAEIAVTLAGQGCAVVVVDRCADDPALGYPLASEADLDAVVAACHETGAAAIGVVADVRDQGALDGAVRRAEDELGGLDIVVAAAGCVAGGRPTWETEDEVWSTMFDVNVHGVRRLARAAVPALLRRPAPRQGRFVVISSMGGSVGLPMLTAYVAAKHAANGVVRSLAAELGAEGITVNAIAPGSTTTAMLTASAAVYGLPDVSGLIDLHLIDRALHPAEVAALAAFVCSPAASGMTGAVLPVDAGATSR